jgi:membrane protein implicated in regulation of membrane protease activity
MTWDQSTAWWVATGLLVVLELASGTFYLLMLAVGTAAGALGVLAGLSFPGQLVAAAVIGGAAVGVWHRRRLSHPAAPPATRNPDMNLDIGSRVHVDGWDAQGEARVNYRGAAWNARFAGTGAPSAGEHVIVAVEGPQLLLDRLSR